MSIRDYEQVININNINNNDYLCLKKNDQLESNLVLSSISIRDFKMLQFIKEALHNGNGVTINIGYKS